MKNFSKILLSLLCIIGFTSGVDAASYSSSITTNTSSTKYEYVKGLPIYYNQASSYNLYILNSDTYFDSRTTLRDPVEVDKGFAYIVNNSNVTSSSYKNYYIAQVAILWYQDYLKGNDLNISSSLKNYILNNTGDTVCYYINKLVNNAKVYGDNGSSITFIDKNITFTKNGNYYYSNVIDVKTNNLKSTPSVKLYNAPTNATIVNNTVTSNGDGSFQIRIPSSSLTSFYERDFEVYITGSGYDYSVYKYSNYGVDEAIYGRVYSTSSNNVEASMPANIKGIGNTKVRISVLNNRGDYISGLSYNIYYGDCTKNTCYSDDLVHSFTTKSNYTELNSVLSEGTYTLVNRSSNNNYNLPDKTKFVVTNTTSIQYVSVEEDEYNIDDDQDDSLRRFTIFNDLDDSTNIIKIYSNSGVLVNSYKSNNTNYEISLTEGTYYIVDSKNKIDKLYFKISSNGSLLVKYEDEYVFANSISLDKDNYSQTIIDDNNNNVDYDEDSNTYYINDDGVSIEITNDVTTTTDVQVDWLSDIIDAPITSLSATMKYIIGAIIISTGLYLVILNVKKSKNNI